MLILQKSGGRVCPSAPTPARQDRVAGIRLLLALVSALCLNTGNARAHMFTLSNLDLTFGNGVLNATVDFPPGYLESVLPPTVKEGDVPAAAAYLNGRAAELLLIKLDGKAVSPKRIDTDINSDVVEIKMVFEAPGEPRRLEVENKFIRLLEGGEQSVLVADLNGRRFAATVMTPAMNELSVDLTRQMGREPSSDDLLGPLPEKQPAPEAPAPPINPNLRPAFFLLGVEHILTGYDHLLFLFGLLLVCERFVTAAKIISLFTLAHTITLALAALDIVHLSSRIVEPAIAASITYVGMENIFSGAKARWRGAVTFCFGLVHGLGFASALRDIGLGRDGQSVIGPLFRFNLGVEAGQLSVAALILPLLFAARRNPAMIKRLVPVCSALVALAGAIWLVQRVWPHR
ncbi:MAG: hypothetical protein QOD99_272 [Chthoniobacter sp.]|jgi:hydrogenase/urease accessory protein HupE|nr:hypothetical protein [Chthoniobacter sp.]